MYKITKHYGHNLGLSACFRQPRAVSHCSKLHGYALAFTVVVGADVLDENDWVMDFGGFKDFKQWLVSTFDHTTLISSEDPELKTFQELHKKDLIDLVILTEGVGCEAFAKIAFKMISMDLYRQPEILDQGNPRNLRVISVTVHEHGGNSATYEGE